jgi:signal peptidase I
MDEAAREQTTPQRKMSHVVPATLLGLLQSGLGQIYLGVAARALWVLALLGTVLLVAGVAGLLSRFSGYVSAMVFALVAHVGLAVDAAVVAWKRGRVRRSYNRWFVLPLVALLLVGAWSGFLKLHASVLGFSVSRIPSRSMAPTFLVGDSILFDTRCCSDDRHPRRGDIIVFKHPEEPAVSYVKRVVGLGGDELEISGGRLVVNGEAIVEPYLLDGNVIPIVKTVVPQGHLYVLGDNRERSSDSRVWGPLRADLVIGRVTTILYSPSRRKLGLGLEKAWTVAPPRSRGVSPTGPQPE